MRHWHTKAQWNSDKCILKAKKRIKEEKKIVTTKKLVLKFYVILVALYSGESWTICSPMKNILEEKEMWIYKKNSMDRTCDHRLRFSVRKTKKEQYLKTERRS